MFSKYDFILLNTITDLTIYHHAPFQSPPVLNTTHKNVGGKPVPNPYRDFMDFLSFMQLDVVKLVPFDCM